MATPGNALIGYAILRANYNAQAPNYLDNFAPFVLSAIASSSTQFVKRDAVSGVIREIFGLNIPTLVVPRLLRRTNRQGLTEPVGNDAVRLTSQGAKDLPDLNVEVAQYRSRQTELVTQLAAFIENRYPEHLELTTRDLGAYLAEFFDRNAVPLLGASLNAKQPVHDKSAGLGYVVATFVDHLYKTDQGRFSYVVEAAKGAMLASVLELDTSSMNESLASLTLVLDSPVVMDILGYHGSVPEAAMRHVLQMATSQGATLAVLRHSISELDGILESIENALHRGRMSRHVSRGYLHFAERGASPVDIALLRERLEDSLIELGIEVLAQPGDYYKYGLDESKLEAMIENRVHYLQDAARRNDVRSLSAVHRMRKGNQSRTIERCKALLISSNQNLVAGARDFSSGLAFPLSVTTEALASILWVRSPALADDVPREIVLASAYVGMQPSPILWKKYVDEIARLEIAGVVTPDEAMILRATSVGREALMGETLGDEGAASEGLPLTVLERVQSAIAEPMQVEVTNLELQLADAEVRMRQTSEEQQREASARLEIETLAKKQSREINEMQRELLQIQKESEEKVKRISEEAARYVHRMIIGISWSLRTIVLLMSAWVFVMISFSTEYPVGSISWALAVIGVLGFAGTFLPPVISVFSKWEEIWAKRRTRKKLLQAGYAVDEMV